MSALFEQQHAFGAALRAERVEEASEFWDHFVEAPARAQKRFAAYQRNVRGNGRVALGASFPVIATLLGPGRFRDLSDDYIAAYPSNNADLNQFGEHFSSFMAEHFLAQTFPYLPDLARLEWALDVAYGAADEPALNFSKLAALPPERQGEVVLVLSSLAIEIVSPWPVFALWQAHQHEDIVQRDAALAKIDLTAQQQTVIVSRDPAGVVLPDLLTSGEAAFRSACLAGQSLNVAIDAALLTEPTLDVAALLPVWQARGWIVDIK